MKICRVEATVTATVKNAALEGRKLMVVQPLDESLAPAGKSYLAVDRVQAGIGDIVLVNSEGNGARQLSGIQISPLRSMIVGIVDAVSLESEERADAK
jgi:microcompartment protein CcmK/EutM